MPLKVTIDITPGDESFCRPLGVLYITRLDELKNFGQTSDYLVGDTMDAVMTNTNVVGFSHTFSDGYETCVRKAIEAREKAGVPT